METYITICKTDNQWDLAVWQRSSDQGSVTTERGETGWQAGGRCKKEGTCVLVHDS